MFGTSEVIGQVKSNNHILSNLCTEINVTSTLSTTCSHLQVVESPSAWSWSGLLHNQIKGQLVPGNPLLRSYLIALALVVYLLWMVAISDAQSWNKQKAHVCLWIRHVVASISSETVITHWQLFHCRPKKLQKKNVFKIYFSILN